MRIALIILVAVHGIIHLAGFLKAFAIFEFNSISQPILKIYGVFWLLTFILFVITVILISIDSKYWLLSGLLAVIISQVLILSYWSDAKYGTIINIIILIAILIGYSSFNFNEKIKTERINLLDNIQEKKQDVITEDELFGLPPIVQKWLSNSGLIEEQHINNVHLTQELQLKLKPEQTNWFTGTAEQYYTIDPK